MKSLIRPVAFALFSVVSGLAQALTIQPFTPQALTEAQQAGKPVAVHFHADWCGTCVQQEKAFRQLSSESGLDLTLLVADYDKEKDLRRQMKVRSQSTVVVFRGVEEKARSGGDTSPDRLRAVLKSAL
ncbi:MAG: hypothetical protein RIS35_2062 [Pseudomonadota bacterium]|jgi:thioredoxin-like negative regulator of GroEL